MSYKELCDRLVGVGPKVSRKFLLPHLLQVTGKDKLPITVSTNLKAKNVRGMFLSVESECDWVKQYGSDIVVISREIFSKSDTGNYCWERFVTVKEMMHLFDNEVEACDTGEKFDELISQFTLTYAAGRTPQMNSEVKCFWRALRLLCPEEYRLKYKQRVAAGVMDNYDVALKFRIPEQYVGHLFRENYEDIVSDDHLG